MFEIESKKPVNPIQVFVFSVVLLIIFLFAYRLLFPTRYAYVVEAKSQLMSLEINPAASGEIKWRTEGLVFCSRTELALPAFTSAQSLCGSHRLKPYHSQDIEQVLQIVAAGSMQLSSRVGGGLQMSLRSADSSEAIARISLSSQSVDVSSASHLVLLWPSQTEQAELEISPSHGVYPFKGKAVFGKDVNWSQNRLLLAGKINLFSGDESAATGRREISKSTLMLGDQLMLEPVVIDGRAWYERILQTTSPAALDANSANARTHFPSGFVHYQDGANSFELRAFGDSDGLELTRYGDLNFDLKPGLFARLSNDPLLAWMTPFLLLLITLSNNLKGIGNISPKFIKLIKKRLFPPRS